jgi:hypothetical protein
VKNNTVGHYMLDKWKYDLDDPPLADVPLDSPVGIDCLKVLNAADTLIDLCPDVGHGGIFDAVVEQLGVFYHS